MRYKVAVQHSEEGFSVSCPGLPGCWSQGATEKEALENIQDAIREYLTAVEESLKKGEASITWTRSGRSRKPGFVWFVPVQNTPPLAPEPPAVRRPLGVLTF